MIGFRWTIRRKLLALGGATVLPLMLLLGFWVWWEIREQIALRERDLELASRQAATQVHGVLDSATSHLRLLAQDAVVGHGAAKAMEEKFRRLRAELPALENVFAVAADGRTFASARPPARGVWPSAADRPWFQRVMATGEPAVSGFQVGRITNEPTAIVAVPLHGGGPPAGVLAAAVGLRHLHVRFEPLSVVEDMTITVVDGGGRVLAHAPAAAEKIGGLWESSASAPSLVRAAPVEGTDWRALASTPRGSLERRVLHKVSLVALPLLGLLGLASVLGLVIAARVWRPLQALAESAQRLGRGEKPGVVPVESSDEAGELARAFDTMAAEILESRRSLEARTAELALMNDAGRLLTETLSLSEVLDRLIELVRTHLDADVVRIWLSEGGTEAFGVKAEAGAEASEGPMRLRAGEGLVGFIAEERAPLVVADVLSDPRLAAQAWTRAQGLASCMGVPLLLNDVIVGVVLVFTRRPREFTRDDITLAQAIALPAALAIRNATLYEEQARSKAEAQGLVEIAQVAGVSDVQALLSDVCRKAARLCGADRAAVFLWDDATSGLVPAVSQLASAEPPAALWTRFREMKPRSLAEGGFLARVLSTRTPVRIDDARSSSLIAPPWVEAFGIKSLLAVPLVAGNRAVGVLVLDTTEAVRPFTDRQADLATAMANHVALLVQKALLLEEIGERLRQAEAHAEIARVLSSTLDLKLLLKAIAQQTARACAMDRCTIHLWADGGVATATSQFADGHEDRALWDASKQLRTLRVEDVPFLAEVIRRPAPLVIDDPAASPLVPAAFSVFKFKALLVVPLRHKEAVVGALVLDNAQQTEPVSRGQVALATTIASQAALALDNARLHDETRSHAQELAERNRQLEVLHDAARAISAEHEVDRLLQAIVEQARDVLGARYAALGVFGDDGRISQFLTAGLTAEEREKIGHLPEGKGLLGYIFRHARTVRLDDLAGHPESVGFPAGHPAMSNLLGAPITYRGEILGALYLTEKARGFTAGDEGVLTILCADAAVAIDGARRLAEEQRRRLEADSLLEIALATGSTLEEKEVLRRIALGSARACRVDRCSIYILDEDGQAVIPVMAQRADGTANPGMWEAFKALGKLKPEAIPFVQEAVQRKQPVLIPDPGTDPRIPEGWAELFQIKSLLAVPLMRQDQAMGVLVFNYMGEARAFTPEQVRLATTLAGQVGLAIENARLVRDLRKALEDVRMAQEHLVKSETLRALGEMAAGIAHHLNNLLAIVLGRTQLLRLKPHEPEVERALAIVERAARDGAEVVRRVHGFSRLQPVARTVAVDLNDLAREVLELTRPRWRDQAHAAGIEIEAALEAGAIPPVAGEPSALREVLVNLVLNAVEALPAGGKIRIRTWASERDVHCSVADTGIGMSEDVRRQALTPFFTTKGPKSTGLGLSVNYGIIRRHGGDLEIESTEGGGTTVSLCLPATVAPPAAEARPAREEPVRSRLRILAIDDEAEVLEVMGEMLETEGHTVVTRAGAREAVALLEADEAFDLVLTDLGMPAMNGWELARTIKARWPGLPVGLVTGWGEEAAAPEDKRGVVDFVIAKPVAIETLAAAVAGLRPGSR